MNLGNTYGKPRKPKEPPIPTGCFNVNALHDWIIGGKVPDERVYASKYQGREYHIPKARGNRSRIY